MLTGLGVLALQTGLILLLVAERRRSRATRDNLALAAEAATIGLWHLDLAEADIPPETEEEAADALVGTPVLPAAPDVLAQDPVHDDIVWLCENWALPRIAAPAPRPSQIIISLADREVPFGAFDPEAVQIFEAFRLPPDRDTCEWEPW